MMFYDNPLPRLADHLLLDSTELTPKRPIMADLWDNTLLPLEVVETTKDIICTIWLHKLPVQAVLVTYTHNRLIVRVTASTQQPNVVTYEREILLNAAVDSTGADVILNDTITTITLPKAKSGLAQRLVGTLDTVLHPRRSTPLLSVKAH